VGLAQGKLTETKKNQGKGFSAAWPTVIFAWGWPPEKWRQNPELRWKWPSQIQIFAWVMALGKFVRYCI
jgi:hypothetical protein